jgi:hypothetical protein
MEQKHNTNSFKKLLDRLQEDSWQLELLISGFAIFGLFNVVNPLKHYLLNAELNSNEMAVRFYQIAIISVYILIFNLLLHVLLRALWIGSLGLRSISGEIEYDKLNYSKKFTKYLKKKVGSFDDYISKLENLSSVMFAISFLLIFYVVAYAIVNYITNNSGYLIAEISVGWIRGGLNILLIVFVIGSILTFIDFITQGLLKKNKWVSMVYFPFYRVFSIFTLSFLYRPLVYNLLDNKFGRRISLLLFPVYFIIFLMTTLHYQASNIIPLWSIDNSTNNIAVGTNYEDVIKNSNNLYVEYFAIQSKIITDPYIKVIIPLRKYIEDPLIDFNHDLKPGKDIRGYYSGFRLTINNRNINEHKKIDIDSLTTEYLNIFEKYYSFKIDSITRKTDFIITNSNDDMGIETYIGIKDLSEGKHIIEFQKLKHKDADSLVSIIKVPFWYYKD